MDCQEIIRRYLDENGFDGLRNEAECGCDVSDLVPCGNDFSVCTPGYMLTPPKTVDCEFNFYICESRDDRPWETDE